MLETFHADVLMALKHVKKKFYMLLFFFSVTQKYCRLRQQNMSLRHTFRIIRIFSKRNNFLLSKREITVNINKAGDE
jgi:hypothetical protein